ncbi:protein MCM10 homolog isoform X1 [Lycorma delicatula]|uniref:protein MCM10 homolog isoform X1 n=2 Tax=Lycorma delicatula TaxID=130591 RepID=UPI003F511AFB
MASLFLFGSAHTALWKRNVGTAIAVLNPSVLESKKESNDEAVLSVNNPDQVMVCGQLKDFGFRKGRKKNGENCTVFVNKSSCEFSVFHVQKEYKKFSHGCSDLQSPTGGGLQKLKNKVLGKNEVQFIFKADVSYGYTLDFRHIRNNISQLRSAMANHVYL